VPEIGLDFVVGVGIELAAAVRAPNPEESAAGVGEVQVGLERRIVIARRNPSIDVVARQDEIAAEGESARQPFGVRAI